MSEPEIIAFDSYITGVKLIPSRGKAKVELEFDAKYLDDPKISEAYHALVNCQIRQIPYRVMIGEAKDIDEAIEHGKAKEKAKEQGQYPDKPMVSEGFPWGIAGKEAFARFLDDTTQHTIFNDDGSFTEARNRNVVRIMYGVKSTKQMTNEQNNELIGKYHAWLKEVR